MKELFTNNLTSRAVVVIALGFFALALAYSVRAVLGLAMPIWEDQLGWSIAFTSNVAAIALLIMAIFGPISGLMLDRKGLRFTLIFGLVAVCLSCIVVSVADNPWVLLFGFGVIGGVGFGTVSTHIVAAAVARMYPSNVGFASSIAMSGSTAGQFLLVPLTAALLGSFSWRWGFAGLAIGTVLLLPFVWYLLDDPSKNDQPVKLRAKTGSHWSADVLRLTKSPVFQLLFWSFLLCGYTTSGVIETHLIPYASYCGFAPVPSATAYGLLSAFNLVGMLCVGWLTDRVNRPLLLASIYIIRGMTFWVLLNVGTSYETLLVFAIAFGAVDYSTVPVTTSLVASHLGLKNVGLVMGLLTAGHQIGAATGAMLGGQLFDQYNNYDFVWISSIALAVIAGVLAFLIKEDSNKSGEFVF